MTHQHTNNNSISKSLKIGIFINLVFIVVEVLFGFFANSMALIADAGHNFSDVVVLLFSWFAILITQRKPTERYTYGLRKSTILIAILNTLILIATVGFIAWGAITRFNSVIEVKSNLVIMIASLGIIVNGFTAWLFAKGREHDLNIKSAFLHFVADMLVSLGVVVAAVIISFTGQGWIDPLVSLIIAAFILYSTYNLLIDSINLALDAVPKNIDIVSIQNYFANHDKIESFHDLHIWALSTSETALTVHLVVACVDDSFIHNTSDYIRKTFNINHCTIQVEQTSQKSCFICN
jgi:cobalt-zinc-cadmium efflux system protein